MTTRKTDARDAWSEPPPPQPRSVTPAMVQAMEQVTPELRQVQVRYAPDARGFTPPAFAVIHLPGTQLHPQRAVELPREPSEDGYTFHFRARVSAWRLAGEQHCKPQDVEVHFMDTMPSRSFRDDMRTRYLLRWHMTRANATTEDRLWAADKMLEVLYGFDLLSAEQRVKDDAQAGHSAAWRYGL